MKFKDLLKNKIQETNATQSEVAETIGCSQSLVNAYLSGSRKPGRMNTLLKVSEFLGISLNELSSSIEEQEKGDGFTETAGCR
ncbi:helix-turn-helix domain-containing protein [Vibrio harveyi]|uniref:helix-turn-helix domain-containing protein n=1 Tax=Vibrio harveyi TaxID=669 RepID=UPI000681D78B|nr:helix-turn-helix transcriptional regulator [Vibrio harveyi]